MGIGSDCCSRAISDTQDSSPGIVCIPSNHAGASNAAIRIELNLVKPDNISLHIQQIVVGAKGATAICGIIEGKRLAINTIDKLQNCCSVAFPHNSPILGDIVMGNAIHGLAASDAGHIIGVTISAAIFRQSRKLSALHPCKIRICGSVIPVSRIAGSIIVDGNTVVFGQQIIPVGIFVGILYNITVSVNAEDISSGIIGVVANCSGSRGGTGAGVGIIGFLGELVLVVVGIFNEGATEDYLLTCFWDGGAELPLGKIFAMTAITILTMQSPQ